MGFEREQGSCCFILPLKFGVGLISMLVFMHSMLCILALFTGDIRLQGNGYNVHTYRIPSVVGSFGLIFGFVGLLGVYDDKTNWVSVFNRYLVLKVLAQTVAGVADMWTLQHCDDWLSSPEHGKATTYGHLGMNYIESNPALDVLSEQRVCPWARWAYVIGFSLDLGVMLYLTYKCFSYEQELRANVQYAIDFAVDRGNVKNRWQFYQVKDPSVDAKHAEKLPTVHEESRMAAPPTAQYGAVGNSTLPLGGDPRSRAPSGSSGINVNSLNSAALASMASRSYGDRHQSLSQSRSPRHGLYAAA